MTAKQAIKARCRDCSGRVCGFEECALKGLAKAKRGADRKYRNPAVLPVVFERPSGKPLQFPGLRHLPVPGGTQGVFENRF
jgi:hypothetical protein